ncbi:helix-turn-helix transcriptional regulator [Actinoplanes sp. LDG1-06]|uniref:Helix-turn-helix transcriptional regulator n=1 Tax=Paractinoplanes ovalisporus TaxID=2810368 RepID=A0ABS2AP96_9ACTN|nr:AAA family ATPase [Actinoplanes ovalisporus]MBM2621656.1 helix-turn-helix transcriptional regulator [Actinoplanes ovalisporus]
MSEPLVGRDEHLRAIAAGLGSGRSVLVHGPRGTGRSAVLAEAARRHGGQVLAVRALPGDDRLPGAGLHRLLTPLRHRAAELSPPAEAALADLFGDDRSETPPAPLAEAVRLLSYTADADQLWVVDDLDRLDETSRTVLIGLHRPILASATGPAPATSMIPVRLGPLRRSESARLLAARPGLRDHPGARLVAAQSRGNPLALTELARHLPPASDLSPITTELPVPPRLRRALAPAVDTLDPVRLRAALLVAFARETPGRAVSAALDQLIPPGVPRFPHSVERAAVIDRAGPADRRAARLDLAARLPRDDPARAWHTARADPRPDETVAAVLDAAGDRLSAAGRVRAAAYALGMAAARSHDRATGRRRSLRAAHNAHLAGEDGWSAAFSAGRASGQVHLLRTMREAWLQGDPHSREELREALRDGCAGGSELLTVWARAVADDEDPHGDAHRLLRSGDRAGRHEPMPPDERAMALGTIGLARHETTEAVRQLTRVLDLAAPGGPHRPLALNALAWARFDLGELDAARAAAVQALAEPSPDRLTADVRAGSLSLLAAVAALRNEPGRDDRLRDARAVLQTFRHAAYDVRLNRAQGMADAVAGHHGLAFHRLRHQYDAVGRPVHHRISDLGLADLAQVAVVVGRPDQVAPIVADAEARVRALRSVRVTALWHRARALLAGAEPAAEADYRLALADPGGDAWPVERAGARMDYAQWLRRRHRPTESRPLLTAARDAFGASGLTAWERRAETELAAAAPPRRPGVPAEGLTPQQREAVRMAALGLTNQQIADRLGLSARTVGTHLSRAYPVLGVTRRSQLSTVLDRL